MITEKEIVSQIQKISQSNTFRSLDIAKSEIYKNIERATSIPPKAKSQLRTMLQNAVAREEFSIAQSYSSRLSGFVSRVTGSVKNIMLTDLISAKISLNMLKNEVFGPATVLSSMEKMLSGTSSDVAKNLLLSVKNQRAVIENMILQKENEINKEKDRREKEKKRREAIKRAEEKRRKEEEERKKKEKMLKELAKRKLRDSLGL